MTREHVYLNGEIVPAADAKISVFDGGFLHGVGLFETMRTYNGVAFRYDAHIERLTTSAKALGLPLRDDLSAWKRGLDDLLSANGLRDARVRITYSAGSVRRPTDVAAEPTVLIVAAPFEPYPSDHYDKGVGVTITDWRQGRHDPLCGHKTLTYFARLLSLQEAIRRGCSEPIWFTTENLLAEGATSNVFVVKANVVKTPPLDTPILAGVSRAVAIECATAAKISCQEIPLTVNDLLDADEAFLTSSTREVMPICRVERKPIADEKPGPITRKLLALYRQVVARECGG